MAVAIAALAALGACDAGSSARPTATARFMIVEGHTAGLDRGCHGRFEFHGLDGLIRCEGFTGRVVDGAVYTPLASTGPVERGDPCSGRTWGVFDYPRYAQELEGFEKDFVAPVPFDPLHPLPALRTAGAAATRRGSAPVRGVATTRYDIDAVGSRIDARFTDDQLEQRRLVSMSVWVDDIGRLRRARWTLEVTEDGRTRPQTTVVELFDYGVPVDVTAPRASDTCDFPELFSRSLGDL